MKYLNALLLLISMVFSVQAQTNGFPKKALEKFHGKVIKFDTDKKITIEVEDGHLMDFIIKTNTVFNDANGKKLKSISLPKNTPVSITAFSVPNGKQATSINTTKQDVGFPGYEPKPHPTNQPPGGVLPEKP